jgi:hypothetical protein
VVVYAGSGALTELQLSRLTEALETGTQLVLAGRLPPAQEAVLRQAGSVASPAATELEDGLAAAGAQSYVKAGAGLWSLTYRTPSQGTIVFLMNPTEKPLRAEPQGSAVSSEGDWRELVSGTAGTGGLLGAVAALDCVMPPKTVWAISLADQ